MVWVQQYDPLGSPVLSTLVAAVPVTVLLVAIAFLRIRIHFAAVLGLAVALLVALAVYRMPATLAGATAIYGAAFGLFPIGWIILNVIFLYQLTVRRGLFAVLRDSLATVAPDARVQVILIAFSFGGFIEGMAGFGAPVAITGAILIQLGFKPLHASALALLANTAPVAFGSLGIPITTLEQVAGLDAHKVSAMVGRQLPFFSLLIPFWVVAAFAGWRGMLGVWPVALTAGAAFAVPQFLISNLHGPWLVDIVSGACSIGATVALSRRWQPRTVWTPNGENATVDPRQGRETETLACEGVGPQPHTAGAPTPASRRSVAQAWMPWAILTVFILFWGTPQFKAVLDRIASPRVAMPHLHGAVQRVPPVAPPDAKPEEAIYKLNFLSATGTGILCAALTAGLCMGFRPRELARVYLETLWRVRFSLLTIAAMLALGNVTKYSGTDATLGLALAQTGVLYPFFGTLLGWLGVALTGSDTASNVLFGSLQRITAEQTGISPILMGAANSSGGVMGKMIDAQSIVVASTATNWYGHEGQILRFVFFHSVALAVLMGLLVLGQAYVYPLTLMVVH
ncbi:MAG: L-lactate permease [Verrucomicrobiae bacterium]|nr:L-lactate permease [Verrucomicrobiae bacterium]